MPAVCLAISSYRNDDAVIALLERALPLVPLLFSSVLVVDSEGTGVVARVIQERGWTAVVYHSASTNLGSAGNLALRLSMASESGADFAYALNHDGELNEETVKNLVSSAAHVPDLGAAYPLRALSNLGMRYDLTGTRAFPMRRVSSATPPPDHVTEVTWGSSNGTLYALAPVRKGLLPWSDLWMGWEDLGYGWLLALHGYRQIIVRDAVFRDPYEFRKVGGRESALHVSDKAAWYVYYSTRNLILINRRLPKPWYIRGLTGVRIVLDGAATLLVRTQKRDRLKLLARGIVDGARGVTGRVQLT